MVTADHFQNIFVTPETPSVLIQQSVHFPRSPQPLANTRLFWICVRACMLSRFSCVRLFATLWTVVCQAPPSMEVSGQEYWSGLPCPPPGDLPESGIKSESLMSPALAGGPLTLVPLGRQGLCLPLANYLVSFSLPDLS